MQMNSRSAGAFGRFRAPARTATPSPQLDPDAMAWFDRMEVEPDNTVKGIVASFFAELKVEGIFHKLDALYLPLATSATDFHRCVQTDAYDLEERAGTPVLIPGVGLDLDASTYMGTNFDPSTAGGGFAQNDMTMFVFVESEENVFGNFIGNTNCRIGRDASGTIFQTRANNTFTVQHPELPTAGKLNAMSRRAGTGYASYQDGVMVASPVNASAALLSAEIEVGRGQTSQPTDAVLSVFGFGSGLSTTQHESLFHAIKRLRAELNGEEYERPPIVPVSQAVWEQMYADTHETSDAFPNGVPPDYSWYEHGRVNRGNAPAPLEFATAWGQVYKADGAVLDDHVIVEVSGLAMWILRRSTGRWEMLQRSPRVSGSAYTEDFQGNDWAPQPYITPPTEVRRFKLIDGRNYHFWPHWNSFGGHRARIDPDDIGGVLVLTSARLVSENDDPIDLETNKVLMGVGGDYWLAYDTEWSQGFENQASIMEGSMRLLGPEPKHVFAVSMTLDDLAAFPPPLAALESVQAYEPPDPEEPVEPPVGEDFLDHEGSQPLSAYLWPAINDMFANNPLINEGSVSFADGRAVFTGNTAALSISGANQSATFPRKAGAAESDFTVAFDVTFGEGIAANSFILGKPESWVFERGTSKIRLKVWHGIGIDAHVSLSSLADNVVGTNYAVAMRYKAEFDEIELFINGASQGSAQLPGDTYDNSSRRFWIGNAASPTWWPNPLTGTVGPLGIFTEALTDQQIASIAAYGLSGPGA